MIGEKSKSCCRKIEKVALGKLVLQKCKTCFTKIEKVIKQNAIVKMRSEKNDGEFFPFCMGI